MSKPELLKVEVVISAAVSPTESVDKVEGAIKNVLGDIEIKQIGMRDAVILESRQTGVGSLSHLRALLGKQRIRKAGLAFLSRRSEGSFLSFGLNRQAAYAGRVSFYRAQEAPLGPIQLTIKGDAQRVVDYLCEIQPEKNNPSRYR